MKRCKIPITVVVILIAFVAGVFVGRCADRNDKKKEYVHEDFISMIPEEDCFLCGEHKNALGSPNWRPNNIGILDLNSFNVHYVEINRYDDGGKLADDPSGVFAMDGMTTENGRVECNLDSDKGYARITITGVGYTIDDEMVENNLCQACLDEMNVKIRYSGTPAEFAVVNYEDRSIHPLVTSTISFGMGDYLIDCQFKEDGEIRLLTAFLPYRY